jgi:triosephosphate isomerase (TIM)
VYNLQKIIKVAHLKKLLIAGNWKMNGSCSSVIELLQGVIKQCTLDQVDWLVCPPFVYLPLANQHLASTSIYLGAQNVCYQAEGAYTGEIAASMLVEQGCQFVIVGHSERRQLFLESDQMVAKRFVMALSHGLTPILCVGETLAERESSKTMDVIYQQLDAVFQAMAIAGVAGEYVIAYEPVWAIGTGKTASPEMAQEVHHAIRKKVVEYDAHFAESVRILYGGSVKPSNANELFEMADIDGALVGGASLNVNDFSEIGLCSNYC